MHDIKYIRNNFSEFKKQVNNRNTEVNLDKILELDTKNRSLIQEKEKLESEKKTLSKQNDKSLFAKSKDFIVVIFLIGLSKLCKKDLIFFLYFKTLSISLGACVIFHGIKW